MLDRWICKITGQLALPYFEKILSIPELIFLICTYLSPEDIFNLIKLEDKFKDILCSKNQDANYFWKKKIEKHFPDDLFSYSSIKNIPWFEVFNKIYNQYYKKTPAQIIKLFSLIHEQDIAMLKKIKISPGFLTKKNDAKQSIISVAKQKKNQLILDFFFQQVMQYFKKNQIGINEEDERGNNILHWAIYCRQSIQLIEHLIVAGVSVENTDGYCRSPLFLAAEDGQIEVVSKLLYEGSIISDNDVCIAAKNGHYEVVNTLLDRGANVNAIYNAYQGEYESAVYLAAQNGHIDIVKLFLTLQADVNIIGQQINENNGTALHIAISNDHRQLVKLLLAYPLTNLNAQTSFGTTALTIALAKQDIELVDFLLKKNVDVSLPIFFNGTINSYNVKAGSHALHLAALVGNLAILKSLFDKSPQLIMTANQAGQLPAQIAHSKIKDEVKLLEYSVMRAQEGDFVYSVCFFKKKITFNFSNPASAFSKIEKIKSANYLINLIFNEVSEQELNQYLPALTNGRLGKIFSKLQNKYPLLQDQVNKYREYENETRISDIQKLFKCF